MIKPKDIQKIFDEVEEKLDKESKKILEEQRNDNN